jgi:hypothetical protein
MIVTAVTRFIHEKGCSITPGLEVPLIDKADAPKMFRDMMQAEQTRKAFTAPAPAGDEDLPSCVCGRTPALIPWNHEVCVKPLWAVRCACGRESKWLKSEVAARSDWTQGSNSMKHAPGPYEAAARAHAVPFIDPASTIVADKPAVNLMPKLPPEWKGSIPPSMIQTRSVEIGGVTQTGPEWNAVWLRGLEKFIRSVVTETRAGLR